MTASSFSRLATLYENYGPGRLPKADRPDVGGGYAHATTMAVFLLIFSYRLTDTIDRFASEFALPAGVPPTLIAVPVFLAVAFVAGSLSWRYLPERVPYFGALAGLLSSAMLHLVGVLLVLVILFENAEGATTLVDLLVMLGSIPGIFFLWTADAPLSFFVLYALGAGGGLLYQRIREAATT